jgi:hypothetical protein
VSSSPRKRGLPIETLTVCKPDARLKFIQSNAEFVVDEVDV